MTRLPLPPIGDPMRQQALQQTMAAELVEHGDGGGRGTRSVLLANDRVTAEVVVDRGMDIAGARIDGIPVGWRSPVPILAPGLVEQSGFGPHRAFFGGLLTTGGIDHIGHPTERSAEGFAYPARKTDAFPMHGRINGTPAVLRSYGVDDGETPVAFVEGELTQVAVFGEHLSLRRRIELEYGSGVLRVRDRVTNRGYLASPLALLYHVNAGWPVAAPGATTAFPGREADPAPLPAPSPFPAETATPYVAGSGRAVASAENVLEGGDIVGMRVSWDTEHLPMVVEWRLTGNAGHYAIGIEPITLLGLEGGFPVLEPGASIECGVDIELVHEHSGGTAGRRARPGADEGASA